MTAAMTQPNPPLTPERIVEVARALISEHGLDWFSMRKLAAALDVNPMTVYLRFENKDELLDAVAHDALATMELPELPDGAWEERALALASAVRSHLLADRNLLAVHSSSGRLSAAVLRAVDQGLELMEEVGYSDEAAVLAFRSLFWHTVGFVLVDNSTVPYLANAPGGVDAVLDKLPGGGAADAAPVLTRYLPHFTSVDADELFAHTTRLLAIGLLADAPGPEPRETTS